MRAAQWFCRLCHTVGVGGPDGWLEHRKRVHSPRGSLGVTTAVLPTLSKPRYGSRSRQFTPVAFGFVPRVADVWQQPDHPETPCDVYERPFDHTVNGSESV